MDIHESPEYTEDSESFGDEYTVVTHELPLYKMIQKAQASRPQGKADRRRKTSERV